MTNKDEHLGTNGIVIARLSAVLMLVLSCFLIAISPFAPRTFTNNSDVARLSTIYLVLACASEPFLGLAMTLLNFIMKLASPWFQWLLTPSFY